MLTSFVVVFREVFEIALILGAIFGYINKTGQVYFKKVVYAGVVLGAAASFFGALFFYKAFSVYQVAARIALQGTTMVAGAFFIVGMIWWSYRQHKKAQGVTERVGRFIQNEEKVGLFLFTFLSVFRDGMEVVIFLGASNFIFSTANVFGVLLGGGAALVSGWLVAQGIRRLPVKNIFLFTTIFLGLLALSLLVQGVHELEEAGVFGNLF